MAYCDFIKTTQDLEINGLCWATCYKPEELAVVSKPPQLPLPHLYSMTPFLVITRRKLAELSVTQKSGCACSKLSAHNAINKHS